MRLHQPRHLFTQRPNIAPLIDVVFLLIIFFLTVSHMALVRVDALSLPDAREGETLDTQPSSTIVINIHAASRIRIAGRTYSLTSIGSRLEQEIQRLGRDRISIRIRADRRVPWKVVSAVMQHCAQRGIVQVQVAVVETERGKIPSDTLD